MRPATSDGSGADSTGNFATTAPKAGWAPKRAWSIRSAFAMPAALARPCPGVPVVVSTDAHSVGALGYAEFGIGQARRGWLTKDQVLNTRTWPTIARMLR